MRARILVPIAALVGGAVAVLLARQLLRRRRNRRAAGSLDGRAPIEAILVYDDSVDVDALAELTMIADAAVTAQAVDAAGDAVVMTGFEDAPATGPHDAGALYGMHTPVAEQTVHADDDRAQAHGENWLEALGHDAVEYGAKPEAVLVFFDEDELDSPPSDHRDRPIADLGSGGPRGL